MKLLQFLVCYQNVFFSVGMIYLFFITSLSDLLASRLVLEHLLGIVWSLLKPHETNYDDNVKIKVYAVELWSWKRTVRYTNSGIG